MKEYTMLALAGALAAAAADLALGTRLLRRRAFWLFQGIMALVTTVVNGYLTWRPIVRYGERFFLNLRLGTIPVEDYLFGFGLLTLNLVLWEHFASRGRRATESRP